MDEKSGEEVRRGWRREGVPDKVIYENIPLMICSRQIAIVSAFSLASGSAHGSFHPLQDHERNESK
jgi:hypothetical protein